MKASPDSAHHREGALRGVRHVESGYTGGHVENPSYQQVCAGSTGHAEAVRVDFDPEVISFRDLLDVFFTIHDPTTLNRQGADVGSQYRSAGSGVLPHCHRTEGREAAPAPEAARFLTPHSASS